MTEFERVLMERDKAEKEDARRSRQDARNAIYDILEDGGSYDDVEDFLAGEYGLEMDYIFDLL